MAKVRHSYVRFFPSDWLAGTARMTRLHKSVYFDICCYNWDKNQACPASELPLMLGDLPNWSALVADLIAAGKLVRTPDGSVENPRAAAEAAHSFDLWERKSSGGRRGAAKTNAEKAAGSDGDSDDRTPNATPASSGGKTGTGVSTQNQNQNQSIDDVDDTRACACEAFDLSDLTDRIARAAGVRHVDPNRIIANQKEVKGWLELGADVETLILPTIAQAVADAERPAHSLKYFDPAVRRAFALDESGAQPNGGKPSGWR